MRKPHLTHKRIRGLCAIIQCPIILGVLRGEADERDYPYLARMIEEAETAIRWVFETERWKEGRMKCF